MSIENIKSHLLELFQNTPDNVGVMYGKKSKNGNFTGENCVVFTVVKKLPIEQLLENEILPTYVEFDGVRYETDVLEVGEHYLFDCQDLMNLGCYSWNGNIMPTTVPPWCCQVPGVPANRNIIRPLQQGISVTSINTSTPTVGVGTLGFFAVDKLTKCLVGVSNNHVLIDNAYYTTQRRDITIIENEYSDDVIQTFDWDAINFGSAPPKIGSVLRYVPIKKQGINYVDGALTTIFSGSVATGLNNTTPKSWFFYGLSGLTNQVLEAPMEWATTQEIDNLMVNPPSQVWSVGRTTGVKQGPCGLQILGVGDSSYVRGYPDAGQTQIIAYADLIRFSRLNNETCTFPIGPGDSGSALIAVIGGKPKIIGLCFAGSIYNGLACRIDRVAEELDIERWDGVNQNFFDPNQQDIFTVIGPSQDKTLVCSGQTYWQVGNTDLDLPCNEQGLFFQIDTMSAFTFNLRVGSMTSIFDMTIYWGDGTSTTYVGAPGYNVSQLVSTLGIYSIQVVFSNYRVVTSLNAGFVSGVAPTTYRFPIINVYNLNLLTNLVTLSISFCKLSSPETLIPQISSTVTQILLYNNSFTSFTSTQFLPVGLTYLNLQNNPLTQTGVNNTLIYLDNIPFNALPPKTINLTSSIPTAIPSGSGLAAKTNLSFESWIVFTL